MQIHEVEDSVAGYYGKIKLDPEFRKVVEAKLSEELGSIRRDSETELHALR